MTEPNQVEDIQNGTRTTTKAAPKPPVVGNVADNPKELKKIAIESIVRALDPETVSKIVNAINEPCKAYVPTEPHITFGSFSPKSDYMGIEIYCHEGNVVFEIAGFKVTEFSKSLKVDEEWKGFEKTKEVVSEALLSIPEIKEAVEKRAREFSKLLDGDINNYSGDNDPVYGLMQLREAFGDRIIDDIEKTHPLNIETKRDSVKKLLDSYCENPSRFQGARNSYLLREVLGISGDVSVIMQDPEIAKAVGETLATLAEKRFRWTIESLMDDMHLTTQDLKEKFPHVIKNINTTLKSYSHRFKGRESEKVSHWIELAGGREMTQGTKNFLLKQAAKFPSKSSMNIVLTITSPEERVNNPKALLALARFLTTESDELIKQVACSNFFDLSDRNNMMINDKYDFENAIAENISKGNHMPPKEVWKKITELKIRFKDELDKYTHKH